MAEPADESAFESAAAFEALYRRTSPAVLAYARRRTPQPHEAEDVLVEVFATAWRRRADLPPDPLPWLYATAANVLAHAARSAARRHRLSTRLAGSRVAAADPADGVARALDARARISIAMASLTGDDREVLRLWAWEDLDSAAIGEVLGCSPGTARTRLARAKARLRAALTPDVHAAEGPQ